MASPPSTSRITWGLLGVVTVVTIAVIISAITYFESRMIQERKESDERIADFESRMMNERNESDERITNLESQMMKERKESDERIANLESRKMNERKEGDERITYFESRIMKELKERDERIADFEIRIVTQLRTRAGHITDFERRIMKELKESDAHINDLNKRIAALESQMNSSKQREDFDKECKGNISSFKNVTDHIQTPCPATFVGFSVGSSKKFTPTNFTRVPMEVDIYNPAKLFRSDNAFHAPMRGVYSFHFGAMSQYGKRADIHLYTQKLGKGKRHVALVYDYSRYGFGGASGSVMVEMHKEETASVWVLGWRDRTVSLSHPPGSKGTTSLFTGKLEYKLD